MRLFFGLLLVLILTIIPIPFDLNAFRPPWVLLFILLIEFYYPKLFKLWRVVLLGLLVDTMLFSTLGVHALSFVLTTWFARSQVGRLQVFPEEQQIIFIGSLCLLNEGFIYLINLFLGFEQIFWPILIKALLATLLWPLLIHINGRTSRSSSFVRPTYSR